MTDEEVASNEARLCGEGLRLRAALKYISPSEYRAYAQAEKALAEPLPEGGDWCSGQASRADLSADRQHRSRVIDERVRRYAATEANLMERFGQVADERGLKAIGRLQSSGQECPTARRVLALRHQPQSQDGLCGGRRSSLRRNQNSLSGYTVPSGPPFASDWRSDTNSTAKASDRCNCA
jgi:hypothetical protein